VHLDELATQRIQQLEATGLLRTPRVLRGPHGPTARIDQRDTLLLSSNDYLGLTGHEQLHRALVLASEQHGLGSAASRLISGTHDSHRDAETALAGLVRQPSALLFSSGYAANVGVLSTLPAEGDVIFSDALNHASIIDGCRLSRAVVHVYPHADVDSLDALLRTHRPRARHAFVVSDALFSMDGDLAPLAALRKLANTHDAALLIDEAHSLGVLGARGAGACEQAGVTPDLIVGTLGKALGLWGAFAAASENTCRLLETSARSFVFSTATSPAAAAASVTACRLVVAADGARTRVLQHATQIRTELRARGWNAPASDAHIVPVLIGSADATMCLSAALLEHGVFVQGIRPPTVPEGGSRLRVAPSAAHTPDMIAKALQAFQAVEALRP